MPVKRPCRAKNQATCPYHGTSPEVQAFITAMTDQSPIDPTAVNTAGVEHNREGFAAAWARYSITNPAPEAVEAWNRAHRMVEAEADLSTTETYVDNLLNVDYGRHRGGPWVILVRNDTHPDGAEYPERAAGHPDLTRENMHLLNEGYSPVAMVHTRNGGGNRECYCDDYDNHDEGCLAVINDKMASHPAYLNDADDDGDYTYANFFFTLDDTPELRRTVQEAELAESVQRTRAKITRIEAGDTPPWTLVDADPKKTQIINGLREDLWAVQNERSNLSYPVAQAVREEDQAKVKAHVDAMEAAVTTLKKENRAEDFLRVLQEGGNQGMFARGASYDGGFISAVRELRTSGLPKIREAEARRVELKEKQELLTEAYNDGRLPAELGNLDTLLGALKQQVRSTPDYQWDRHRKRVAVITTQMQTLIKQYRSYDPIKKEEDRIQAKLRPLEVNHYESWTQ